MNRFLRGVDLVSTPLLVLCAITVTSFTVRNQFFPPAPAQIPEPSGYLRGRPVQQKLQLSLGHFVGSPKAAHRVIEFADFQCPFCAKASEQIHRLAEEHPGRLAIEYHHLPIAAHPFARRAALAAECAAAQGRFEPFYYLVFGNQTKLGKWSWNEFAKRAGVTNVTAFDTCLKSERFGQQVDADAEAADRLGVGGTPAWISNDSIFAGAPSLKQLERWIGKDSTRPPETVRTSSLDGGD